MQTLKDSNFYPVSLDEIMSNTFRKECAGKKLFCIHFDDGHASQVRLLNDSTLDPDCMLGIVLKYFHDPRAAFFININNGGSRPFGNDSERKLAWLKSRGMTVGNHSAHHKRLDLQTRTIMIREIAEVFEYTGQDTMYLSYPYGARIDDEKFLRKGFHYRNHDFYVKAAFTEVEEIVQFNDFWDRIQLWRYLCPLSNTDEFDNRKYELPRINISTLEGFYTDIIRNPYVFQLDSVPEEAKTDTVKIVSP